jgi:arginine N-succinyltransferase
MLIIRSVEASDLDSIYELSLLMNFINLPQDQEALNDKIKSSIESFKNPSPVLWKNHYIFVIEDLEEKKVIGVSMIHAQHGTEEEPHFYLKVGREKKYSETLRSGFIHGTLKLGIETDGPTEIGGLVLMPEYRQSPLKIGKVLSYVRFLYLGLHPENFKKEIHAELLPPFDSEGNSPLWEAIGRRFTNMNYHEADLLSRTNKEFILTFYPREKIYETLLPMEARSAIGEVGKETKPVKRMLEAIGFKYTKQVDPFDGGPHYRAKLKDIKVIKKMFNGKIVFDTGFNKSTATPTIITLPCPKGKFLAARVMANVIENSQIIISSKDLPGYKIPEDFKSSGIFLDLKEK